MDQMRKCVECSKVKSVFDFYFSTARKDGLQPKCKKCCKVNQKKNYLTKYDLTPEEYQQRLSEQNGVCYICKQPETAKSPKGIGIKALAVDHCHAKGHTRKLLCTRCNSGLGMFLDDPQLLRRAADYLEEHNGRTEDAPEAGGP